MRKRILSLFIALIMILTLFAGCGKKDGSGKTLSYPVSEEPRCLDPQIAEGDAALTAVYNTMLGLVKIDGNNKIIPAELRNGRYRATERHTPFTLPTAFSGTFSTIPRRLSARISIPA